MKLTSNIVYRKRVGDWKYNKNCF